MAVLKHLRVTQKQLEVIKAMAAGQRLTVYSMYVPGRRNLSPYLNDEGRHTNVHARTVGGLLRRKLITIDLARWRRKGFVIPLRLTERGRALARGSWR